MFMYLVLMALIKNSPNPYQATICASMLSAEMLARSSWNKHDLQSILKFSDANSRKQEAEWKEKAIKELEEWYARQDENLQKTKASNR